MTSTKILIPGGVDEYIADCPDEVRAQLSIIRIAIKTVTPGAIETVSYFQIPGYSYKGYEYNGMFAWFSYKQPFIRLHVIPPVIDNFAKKLTNYETTKSVVSFPVDADLPVSLIKDMVKASIEVMKDKSWLLLGHLRFEPVDIGDSWGVYAVKDWEIGSNKLGNLDDFKDLL